ncbi:hypothetical protein H8A99_44255, partial [Bradyrhizobium sp. Arg68]|nr:hypothetical protein [Bradyrhizobium ivorense]
YASMWNRQREAEAARERLAQVDDNGSAPNRLPPVVAEPTEDSAADRGEKPLPTAAE